MRYFLKSARLGFRLWTHDDLPLACELWGDARVTGFIGASAGFTEDQIKERLSKEITLMESHRVQYWPIFNLTHERFIGCCGLQPYKPDESIYELGVHLCTREWGKGYGVEACQAVMQYAFEVWGFKKIFAGHHPKNEASGRLLRKLGFRYTHDEFYQPTGLNHPSYVITKAEFIKSNV